MQFSVFLKFIQIDGYVSVDFKSFEKIVDLLGGVSIELNSLQWLPRVTLHRVVWMHGFSSMVDWLDVSKNNLELGPRNLKCALLSIRAESEGLRRN